MESAYTFSSLIKSKCILLLHSILNRVPQSFAQFLSICADNGVVGLMCLFFNPFSACAIVHPPMLPENGFCCLPLGELAGYLSLWVILDCYQYVRFGC
jgi:hypothetical protein